MSKLAANRPRRGRKSTLWGIIEEGNPISRVHSPKVDMNATPLLTEAWEVLRVPFYFYRMPMLIRARVLSPVEFGRSRKRGTLYYRVQLESLEDNPVCVW